MSIRALLLILFTASAFLYIDNRYNKALDQATAYNRYVLEKFCKPNVFGELHDDNIHR